MRKFKDLIEARDDIAAFTLGRFNPPTTGHEKLITKLDSIAKKNSSSMYVFPTHTKDAARNPLPHNLKVAYMKKMYKKYAKNIQISKARNIFEIAKLLYDKGHKSVIMVVGSDRVTEFTKLLDKYNGVKSTHGFYEFENIQVLSAGERDPDAEDISGMSASKMRAAAADGDKDSFLQGVPSSFKDGDKLYRDVRKYMGIREERDMGDMTDFEAIRDAYLTGKIWNVDDIVESKGVSGKVVRKGTNYLSFVDEEGKVHKAWLHDISIDEARMSPLDKLKKFDRNRIGGAKIFKDRGVEFIRMSKKGQKTIMNVPADEFDKWTKKGYEIVEDVDLDEDASVYKKTARKNKNDVTYAFGRTKKLDGQPKENGGYWVWKLSKNYDGKVRGGIRNSWVYVAKDLSYSDAVKLMNKKLGRKEFKEEVDLDERNYAKEYTNYHSRPEQIANRSSRNKARRIMGDKTKIGMDVGHKDNNPLNNDPKNLRNEDPSKNRREPRLRGKEIDEMSWYLKAIQKIHQMTHPTGYEKLALKYTDQMKKALFTTKKADSNKIIKNIIHDYEGSLTARSLADYINKLIKKGVLPQELKAEYEVNEIFSFREFVELINKKPK